MDVERTQCGEITETVDGLAEHFTRSMGAGAMLGSKLVAEQQDSTPDDAGSQN